MNHSSSASSAEPGQGPSPEGARNRRVALGGLFVRRECWTISLKAKLVGVAGFLVLAFVILWKAHSFLAVTDPVPAEILLVDGFISPYALDQVAEEFRRGKYQHVLVVRCVYAVDGLKYDPAKKYNDFIANFLVQYGVPRERIDSLFAQAPLKDRSFYAALEAKRWLLDHGYSVASLDLATLGPHARRSRLLYEKAFGRDSTIGIIAVHDIAYDERHWWRSSAGVREVVGEGIAYVYVRIFFGTPN